MQKKNVLNKGILIGMLSGMCLFGMACQSKEPVDTAGEQVQSTETTEAAETVAADSSKDMVETEAAPEAEDSSESPGIISTISMAKFEAMMEAGQSFLVSFVTTQCPYCHDFHAVLEEYNKDHAIVMYQVILDYEETGEEANRELVHSYFEEFATVPGVFYVENGKNSSYMDAYHLGISKEVFSNWIDSLGIDTTVK